MEEPGAVAERFKGIVLMATNMPESDQDSYDRGFAPVPLAMQETHDDVMRLFDTMAHPFGGFWAGSQPGEVVLRSFSRHIGEGEFSDNARRVLACLRSNREARYMERRSDDPGLKLPPGLIDDEMAGTVLETIADQGTDEQVRELTQRIVNNLADTNDALPMQDRFANMSRDVTILTPDQQRLFLLGLSHQYRKRHQDKKKEE